MSGHGLCFCFSPVNSQPSEFKYAQTLRFALVLSESQTQFQSLTQFCIMMYAGILFSMPCSVFFLSLKVIVNHPSRLLGVTSVG